MEEGKGGIGRGETEEGETEGDIEGEEEGKEDEEE